MSTVYSTQFIVEHGLNGTAAFTCPSGLVMVVRDMDIWNGAGGISSAFLKGGAGQAIWARHWATGDGASHEEWRGRQVILEGQDVSVQTDLAMDVSVSGYLLSLP